MPEAVNVRQETLLNTEGISDYVEARSSEYGLAPIDTTLWFPFQYTRGARGDMGPTLPDRHVGLSAIYAAVSERDARDVAIDKTTITKIQAVLRREPPPGPGVITRAESESLAETLGILNQLRTSDAGWRESNATWDQYDQKAIPERDPDKIGANEIRKLVEVFGPSVITYGQRLHSKILSAPPPPPLPPGAHIMFDTIVGSVEADLAAGATPADVAVRAQLHSPVIGGAPPPPEAVSRARKYIAQQLFKTLGGVSDANYGRMRLAPVRGLNTDLAGEDPWNTILSPLAYEHNVLRKYRGGATEDAYRYVIAHFAELAPWRELMNGMAANGGVVPQEESIRVPDIRGGTRNFSIISTTKFAQRSAKIVGGFREVLDGDGKKVMNILGGIVGRWRTVTDPVENRLRSSETANSFVHAMKVLQQRREAPPFDLKAWDGLKNTLVNSYAERFTFGEVYNMEQSLRAAINNSKEKRGIISDSAVAIYNLAQVIGSDKPQFIK